MVPNMIAKTGAKILVVDDSAVVRRMMTAAIESDRDLQVVGIAGNGEAALKQVEALRPDLVTLDMEMPVMDGMEAIYLLRKGYPRLPIIVCSSLTQRGAQVTFEALSAGANDYLPKPAQQQDRDAAHRYLCKELVSRIRALCRLDGPMAVAAKPAVSPARVIEPNVARPTVSRNAKVDIVAIGSSTGGPNALAELFKTLSPALPVPIVVVQHMPALFTRYLAERLATQTSHAICEASANSPLLPGHIYIAPGDYHLEVKKDGRQLIAHLHQAASENSCRPAVDVTFRSLAHICHAHVLGIVLTGMGQDGLNGCRSLSEAGSRVWVQDRASSVVWGMPGSIANAGLADKVMPLAEFATSIEQVLRSGHTAARELVAKR